MPLSLEGMTLTLAWISFSESFSGYAGPPAASATFEIGSKTQLERLPEGAQTLFGELGPFNLF